MIIRDYDRFEATVSFQVSAIALSQWLKVAENVSLSQFKTGTVGRFICLLINDGVADPLFQGMRVVDI